MYKVKEHLNFVNITKLLIGIAIFILIGFIFVDYARIRSVLSSANILYLLLSVGFGYLSYFFVSLNFALLAQIADIRSPFKNLLKEGFLSATVVNLISLAGMTSITAKVGLLKKYESSNSKLVAFSIFQTSISNLPFVILLPLSLIHLFSFGALNSDDSGKIALYLFIMLLLVVLLNLVFFIQPIRKRLLHICYLVAVRFIKDINYGRVERLENSFNVFVTQIRDQLPLFILSLLACVFDWVFKTLSLLFCFQALGVSITVLSVLTALFLGMVIGFISPIPGGIGIQETSMSGILLLLGVPFDQTIFGAILFRVVYYVVPFITAYAYANSDWPIIKSIFKRFSYKI